MCVEIFSQMYKKKNISFYIYYIMAQIFCSRGRPVELLLDVLQILLDVQQDSTGRPLEFCKFASNVLELLISSRNAIKISTGRPVEFLLDVPQNLLDVQQNCSTGRPLEQKIWPIKESLGCCWGKLASISLSHCHNMPIRVRFIWIPKVRQYI